MTLRKSRFAEEDIEDLGFNERQKTAISYLRENKQISNQEHRTLNKIGKNAAVNDLNQLVEKGILRIIGRGRSLKYELNEKKTNRTIRGRLKGD